MLWTPPNLPQLIMHFIRSVVAGYSIKMSTALSQAAITGGALGAVAYTLTRTHPHDPHRTPTGPLLTLTWPSC